MAQVSNTSPGMQQAANDFISTDQEIDGFAAELRAKIDNMKWRGQSAEAFKLTMSEWNVEFAKIQKHLDVMAEILKGQSVNILSTEDEARLAAASFFNNNPGVPFGPQG